MQRLILIAGFVLMFTMTANTSQAADGQPLPQGQPQYQQQTTSRQFRPVSKAMELNRRKNQFVIRTVFGR